MNFHLEIIWLVFIISLNQSPQTVDAGKLPRSGEDVKYTAKCLNYIAGRDFVPEWFQGRLTYGEFIEEFCKDKDTSSVVEKMKKYSGRPQVPKLRSCFQLYNRERLYDEYIEFGQSEFEKLPKQSLHSQLSQLDDQEHFASEDNANKNDIFDLSKFIIGMCYKDKPVEYDQLEKKEDKEATITCLQKCASKFFDKIDSILTGRRFIIRINLSNSGITEVKIRLKQINRNEYPNEVRYIEEQSKIQDELSKLSFDEAFQNSESQDLQELKMLSEKFLKFYYEAYASEEDFLSKADAKLIQEINSEMQSNPKNKEDNKKKENDDMTTTSQQQQLNNKEIVDDRLSSSFMYYKSCSERQCFMGTSSLPMYDYVYGEVKKTRPSDRTESEQHIKTDNEVKQTLATTATDENKTRCNFFEVLISKDDNSVGNESTNIQQ